MKIDIRVLLVITCLLLIAAAGVVIAKNVRGTVSRTISETIPRSGHPTAGRVEPGGLQVAIDVTGLTVNVGNCDINGWDDNFFIHLYTNGVRDKSPDKFVGMDFRLQDEIAKIPNEKRTASCAVHKSFTNYSVRAIGFGQFRIPDGKCCDVLWSRFYDFESNFAP